jgi:hypothetical protein
MLDYIDVSQAIRETIGMRDTEELCRDAFFRNKLTQRIGFARGIRENTCG